MWESAAPLPGTRAVAAPVLDPCPLCKGGEHSAQHLLYNKQLLVAGGGRAVVKDAHGEAFPCPVATGKVQTFALEAGKPPLLTAEAVRDSLLLVRGSPKQIHRTAVLLNQYYYAFLAGRFSPHTLTYGKDGCISEQSMNNFRLRAERPRLTLQQKRRRAARNAANRTRKARRQERLADDRAAETEQLPCSWAIPHATFAHLGSFDVVLRQGCLRKTLR